MSLKPLLLAATGLCLAAPAAGQGVQPTDIPGLLAFWDFQEPAGSDRVSEGEYRYALKEMNGPIRRVEDGVFGPYAADFDWGQWFRIRREDAPGLDLHGPDQEVSMVAWVMRESDRPWQYIGGVWNELYASRQYAIFMSGLWQTDYTTYERTPAEHQAMGYISPYGGASPGHPFAFDYAVGATRLQRGQWYMLAYTYDGEVIKVYVDGTLDRNGNYNPFYPRDNGIFDGGLEPADFTVALRAVPRWPRYPEGVPENEAGFDGRLAGLAVYDRALTAREISRLYSGTLRRIKASD